MNKLEAVKAMVGGKKVINDLMQYNEKYIFFDANFVDSPFNIVFGDTGVVSMDDSYWATDCWEIYEEPKKTKKVYLWRYKNHCGLHISGHYFETEEQFRDAYCQTGPTWRVDESEWEVEDV